VQKTSFVHIVKGGGRSGHTRASLQLTLIGYANQAHREYSYLFVAAFWRTSDVRESIDLPINRANDRDLKCVVFNIAIVTVNQRNYCIKQTTSILPELRYDPHCSTLNQLVFISE